MSPAEASKANEANEASEANAANETGELDVLGRPRSRLFANDLAPHAVHRRVFRSIYWAIWFVLAPLFFAIVLVWALAPASGAELEGVWGYLQSWVREQPVPVAIVAFTFFEMGFWSIRGHLPLASHAHPPLRPDLPPTAREAFEKAMALLDETDATLSRRAKVIAREMPERDREKLRDRLDALERAMHASPFDEEALVEALLKADAEVDVRLGRWRKSEVREYVESIVVAVGVAMALRAFVVEAFKIPSGSMIPTLQVGDHIFVNKFAYGPAIPWTNTRVWSHMPPDRGDVMVFAYPEHPDQDFIKRVIGVPGDTLTTNEGHPVINGWEVPSCEAGAYSYTDAADRIAHEGTLFVEYLEDESYLTLYDRQMAGESINPGPWYVKPDEVFVMGDNRNNSHDSRAWFNRQGGGVPYANIRGRALFIWLTVSETTDWSRFFAPVMGRPPGHGPFASLPANMKVLEPAIEKCLRERPPLSRTHPPAGPKVIR